MYIYNCIYIYIYILYTYMYTYTYISNIIKAPFVAESFNRDLRAAAFTGTNSTLMITVKVISVVIIRRIIIIIIVNSSNRNSSHSNRDNTQS